MKLIKTHLRSTMCDVRLSNIAILSIESSRAESLNLDAFVDEFDSRHQNRKLALHYSVKRNVDNKVCYFGCLESN